jgi:hypothetical protein
MHDIDRTQLESAMDALESDSFEFSEESAVYAETEAESPFNEVEEMDLAAELLAVSDEAELDQFLGKLIKGAWRGIRKVGSVVGRIARPLGGVLKGLAKKALPFVGGALGSFIPIPGVGTALGSALGSAVGKALETEFEGMNPEDREFEMARRFVQLAGAAARQAGQSQPGVDPQQAIKAAVTAAANRYVPGLSLGTTTPSTTGGPGSPGAGGRPGQSGRWVRRGRKIVVLGV